MSPLKATQLLLEVEAQAPQEALCPRKGQTPFLVLSLHQAEDVAQVPM